MNREYTDPCLLLSFSNLLLGSMLSKSMSLARTRFSLEDFVPSAGRT